MIKASAVTSFSYYANVDNPGDAHCPGCPMENGIRHVDHLCWNITTIPFEGTVQYGEVTSDGSTPPQQLVDLKKQQNKKLHFNGLLEVCTAGFFGQDPARSAWLQYRSGPARGSETKLLPGPGPARKRN